MYSVPIARDVFESHHATEHNGNHRDEELKEDKDLVLVHVGNLRYQPQKESHLVQCLNAKLDFKGAILNCELFKGWAILTLRSEADSDLLISCDCKYGGHVLSLEKLVARNKGNNESFVFESVEIGRYVSRVGGCFQSPLKLSSGSFELVRAVSAKMRLLIDVDGIEVTLEIPLRHLNLCRQDIAKGILELQFDSPPKCFKSISGALEFESNGVLGHFMTFRFCYSLRALRLITAALLKFGIRAAFFSASTSVIVSASNLGWSGGYDFVFNALSFQVKYMLHALASTSKITFDGELAYDTLACLQSTTESLAVKILEELFAMSARISPLNYLSLRLSSDSKLYDIEDKGVRRICITPLRIVPRVDKESKFPLSNRILRFYKDLKDRFIRVCFTDEELDSLNSVRTADVLARIKNLMDDGIIVGGRKFVFLGYSSSQIRSHSSWFYDQTCDQDNVPTAEDIRSSMGDLSHIKSVGKYAARVGQGFSGSTETIEILDNEVVVYSDLVRNGFCFSDGIGMISSDAADLVAASLDLNFTPSAFQIRYKGAKGVLSIAPNGTINNGIKIALRENSMIKFKGNPEHKHLEVLNYAMPMRCFLNKQIISLLSFLGVTNRTLLNLSREAIDNILDTSTDTQLAKTFLSEHSKCHPAHAIVSAWFLNQDDSFLKAMIRSIRNEHIQNINLKTRILVKKGIYLIGILDESGLLPEDCIFYQFRDYTTQQLICRPDGERTLVFRSPSLHPGDLRVLIQKQITALRYLENVIVFSQHGSRPSVDKMSGGDLDGDSFSIIFDSQLVPEAVYPPMDFTSPSPSVMENISGVDIQNFYLHYIEKDNLGCIANAHLASSDHYGPTHLNSLALAKLHSEAVDFPKTGIAARMDSALNLSKYPDFMGRKEPACSYESGEILGQIYRMAAKFDSPYPFNSPCIDQDLLIAGHENFIPEAESACIEYNSKLWAIMERNAEVDEAVLLLGFVDLRRRNASSDYSDSLMIRKISELQNDTRFRFYNELGIDEDDLNSSPNPNIELVILQKISAWYKVTYGGSHCNQKPHLLSFCWCASGPLARLMSYKSFLHRT